CLRHSALLLHSLSSLCPLSFPLFITRSPLVRNLSPSLRLCLALYGSHSFSEVFLGHFVTMPKEHQTNPPSTCTSTHTHTHTNTHTHVHAHTHTHTHKEPHTHTHTDTHK